MRHVGLDVYQPDSFIKNLIESVKPAWTEDELKQTESGTYYFKNDINIDLGMSELYIRDEVITDAWRHLYYKAAQFVASSMMGKKEYTVFRFIPLVEVLDNRGFIGVMRIMVVIDIFGVYREKDVVIHEMIWSTNRVTHGPEIIEWKCGACGCVNNIKERHCTQCGYGRQELAQDVLKRS